MWQLQSLAKSCPCPSHDEEIKQDLGSAAVTEGEGWIWSQVETLCFTWETWEIFALLEKNIIMHKSPTAPPWDPSIEAKSSSGEGHRQGRGWFGYSWDCGSSHWPAARSKSPSGSGGPWCWHRCGSWQVSGSHLWIKAQMSLQQHHSPTLSPHRKVCHCPSPPGTKSLSFYTNPSFWQHFTLYCLGCKSLISSLLVWLFHIYFLQNPRAKGTFPYPLNTSCVGVFGI